MWPYLTQLCLLLEILGQRGAHFEKKKKEGGQQKERKGEEWREEEEGERERQERDEKERERERENDYQGSSRFPLPFLPLNHFKCSENAPEVLAV